MPSADLSIVFSALADPTRRAILARLAEGDAPVKDLAEPFELSGPAVTKHLKVLERAGLISRSRAGQQRPCRLEPRGLAPAADWLEHYRAMWEDALDRLGEHLATVAVQPAAPTPRRAQATRKTPRTRNAKGERNERKR